MAYPVPENEVERNEALRSYRIMDAPPEIAFTDIGDLAALALTKCSRIAMPSAVR
jgi:hypothetical protein